MPNDMKYWAVIPAAGSGHRMQNEIPKQYLHINGKTILEHTLGKFINHPKINKTFVAIASNDTYWDKLSISGHASLEKVEGGEERYHSVLNCMYHLSSIADDDDWVLVHDAARPCIRTSDIDKLIEKLDGSETGGLLALPVKDTMKRADDDYQVINTIERKNLWHALTPQMYRFRKLLNALEKCADQEIMVTDEAQAMEFNGNLSVLIEAHPDNIKVTDRNDLPLAEFYLLQQEKGS